MNSQIFSEILAADGPRLRTQFTVNGVAGKNDALLVILGDRVARQQKLSA